MSSSAKLLWHAVMEDGAASSHRPDIARVTSPHAPEVLGGAAGLRGPGASVPLDDGAPSHCPNIARVASPHVQEGLDGAAGLRGPDASVPLHDGVKEISIFVESGLIKATYVWACGGE